MFYIKLDKEIPRFWSDHDIRRCCFSLIPYLHFEWKTSWLLNECYLEDTLQLGCPLTPNTTTGLSSVHVWASGWNRHLPVLWGAAGRRGAQAAGLPFGLMNQAAARDLPSVTGGAAVWSSFDSHLLSTVHLWQPDCKSTRVESTKCRQRQRVKY